MGQVQQREQAQKLCQSSRKRRGSHQETFSLVRPQARTEVFCDQAAGQGVLKPALNERQQRPQRLGAPRLRFCLVLAVVGRQLMDTSALTGRVACPTRRAAVRFWTQQRMVFTGIDFNRHSLVTSLTCRFFRAQLDTRSP